MMRLVPGYKGLRAHQSSIWRLSTVRTRLQAAGWHRTESISPSLTDGRYGNEYSNEFSNEFTPRSPDVHLKKSAAKPPLVKFKQLVKPPFGWCWLNR